MKNNNPSLAEATRVWGRIGILSLGGPAAQIALMHRELVDQRSWLTEKQFLNALSFCMLLPGPEAMQLATYSGWRMHGTLGGIIAGLLFVLPGACIILSLAALYATFGQVPIVEGLFSGVKAAVIVIVIEALIRVSKKALHGFDHWVIAILAFVGIFFFALPYPLIVILAAIYGLITAKPYEQSKSVVDQNWSIKSTSLTIATWLFIWWAPLLLLYGLFPQSLLNEIGLFFSKLAVVTFGGAYAVLAYMGQDVVQNSGWLTTGEMMDGLGLAETTPGPLILVTQFVGFIAAHKQGGFWLGAAASAVTLWATFAPCLLWIFTGAPYIEWISNQPRLKGALDAITAAVVGVILNLSIWFALHVLFKQINTSKLGWLTVTQPDLQSVDLKIVALTVLCAVLLLKLHWNIVRVLILAGAAGAALQFI